MSHYIEELILRMREATSQKVANTAMISAADLSVAADVLEQTEAARMAAISRLCEAEVACATACQERDALAAELKAAREQEPVAVYKGHRHIPSDTKEFWGMADNHLPAGTHLYAHPIPACELTTSAICELCSEADDINDFGYAIERYLKKKGK